MDDETEKQLRDLEETANKLLHSTDDPELRAFAKLVRATANEFRTRPEPDEK